MSNAVNSTFFHYQPIYIVFLNKIYFYNNIFRLQNKKGFYFIIIPTSSISSSIISQKSEAFWVFETTINDDEVAQILWTKNTWNLDFISGWKFGDSGKIQGNIRFNFLQSAISLQPTSNKFNSDSIIISIWLVKCCRWHKIRKVISEPNSSNESIIGAFLNESTNSFDFSTSLHRTSSMAQFCTNYNPTNQNCPIDGLKNYNCYQFPFYFSYILTPKKENYNDLWCIFWSILNILEKLLTKHVLIALTSDNFEYPRGS
ncbi:unnamed protein product [Caenorhabditis angaria]|uniref:Uncharacterized protein n=1 Tax=Caenorhabditis angaria TaxID=860376 RepID=A0A9P1I4W7_9PELO|nr:unnamed protein product [Caenorhabditis angaria]